MISRIIEKSHFTFQEGFDSWEDAIRASCRPLEADGTVESSYGELIIECVKKYGPYIVIAPMIALPHSQENAEGVNKTAVSFMKVEKPVVFDPEDREKDARLFFTIASENHEQHLENLTILAEMLVDENLVNDLLEVTNEQELKQVATKYNL